VVRRASVWMSSIEIERHQAKHFGEKKPLKSRSSNESDFAYLLRKASLPEHEQNYRFSDRLWTFDHAWPDLLFAVEVDGLRKQGNGNHQTEKGVTNDCRKSIYAMRFGWTVLRVTKTMINDGSAVDAAKYFINKKIQERK